MLVELEKSLVCGDCRAKLTDLGAVLDPEVKEIALGALCQACPSPAMMATSAIVVNAGCTALVREHNLATKTDVHRRAVPAKLGARTYESWGEAPLPLPDEAVVPLMRLRSELEAKRNAYVREKAAEFVARWGAESKGGDADDLMIEQAVRVARKLYDASTGA